MDERAMIRRAREAVARGDQAAARQLLAGLLHEQPDSETAWMMMSTLVEQPAHKRDCLERVLHINPDSDVARAQLAALQAPESEPTPQAETSATVEAEPTSPPEAEPAAETAPAVESEPAAETISPAEAGEEASQPALEPEPAEPAAVGAPGAEEMVEADEVEAGDVAMDLAPPWEEEPIVAPQDTTVEAVGAVPSPEDGGELPPLAPAPEAGMVPSAPLAAGRALVGEEAATVLSNSMLVDSLAPGEQVLQRTTLTPWVFSRPVLALLGAVIVVSLPGGTVPEALLLACRAGLLVLAFAYFGLRAIRYFGSEYIVTDQRVLAKRGFLARLRVDIPLDEIEEVTVGRSSSGAGSLWIRRSDGSRIMFWRIREPGAFRDAIEQGRSAIAGSTETRSL